MDATTGLVFGQGFRLRRTGCKHDRETTDIRIETQLIRGDFAVPDQDIIRIKCPILSCQRVLAVPVTARGRLVRCRACGNTLRIPQKSASPGTPAPAESKSEQPAKSAQK